MKATDITSRHEAEREFHNQRFSSENDRTPYRHTGFKSNIFNRLLERMGDIEGKKVVEIGCGEGWLTRILAKKKADVYSFDISDEAIEKVRAMLRNEGLEERVTLDRMAAEDLSYPSNTFDIVIGSAILHHLDLEISAREIWRVLKPGGKGYFMEPLGHNPFLNLYRKLTPHLRSEDEQPLLWNHMNIYHKQFTNFVHEEFYLVSFFALFWYFLKRDKFVRKTRDMLLPVDRMLLSLMPVLRKHCWYSLMIVEK